MLGIQKLAVAGTIWPHDFLVVHEVRVALDARLTTPVEVNNADAISHHAYIVRTKVAVDQVLEVEAVHQVLQSLFGLNGKTTVELNVPLHRLHHQHGSSVHKLLRCI